MTKLIKILKEIAKAMGYDGDLNFLMQCAAVLYWKMMYGDWRQ